tara:strand:- start:842 stop:1957 length:1116 start_codon:yes stop_codon:yes gene_type:complete
MNWRGNLLRACEVAGLPILEPFVRLAAGEDKGDQLKGIAKYVLLPMVAIALFLVMWNAAAKTVVTDSAKLPSPAATWDAGRQLIAMHFEQKQVDRLAKQEKLSEAVYMVAEANAYDAAAARSTGAKQDALTAKAATLKTRALAAANYQASSAPTFIDQIWTSVSTVFFGFLLATIVAVPLGVLCGMSPWCNAALTPFIQIFKPVSPLAWLPLAFIVIMWYYAGYASGETYFDKAFLISATTVCLCSLWPTLVNTTLGVASVDKDFINVADVLRLSWMQRLFKIILPASLPLMFAGMRISLGVGWMVLIAADMLAQNPGLGKFVWDEFQNGSELTYARIAFSVIVIGMIGLVLDRFMIFLRNLVSFGNPATA